MNLWTQLKKSKMTFAAYCILAAITLTAIYAPLLSNNKPLVIYTKNTFIYTDYLDSAQGTLNLIIDHLNSNKTPKSEHINWLKESLRQSLLFLKDTSIIEQIQTYPINVLIQNRNLQKLNELKKELKKIEKSPLKPRFFFPAFNTLTSGDLFFMLLLPIFFIFQILKRFFISLQSWPFFKILFLSLILSLFFSILYSNLKTDHLDSYNYKKITQQFYKGEWVLFPIVPYGENENRMAESSQPPSFLLSEKKPDQQLHLLGTDTNGRDVLSRMIYGSRVSMSVGFVAVSIYVFIGIIIGSLAGFYGGFTDIFISRLIEIMICFPVFFLILTVMAFLKPSIFNIMVIIGLTGWTGIARLMRGEFLRLKNQEFVLAAQSMGASDFRLIFHHIFPNGVNPILISATFGIAGAILTESALSFLGFGVPQPTASWGDTLSNGRNDIYGTWWLTVFPGIAIFITVTCFNLIGEKLRDLLDPKMKERS